MNSHTENRVRSLLQDTGVEVHPDEFAVISVARDLWPRLLENGSLSPSGRHPYMIFSDPFEVTLVLSADDLANIRPSLGNSRFERGFRLLTFTVQMDLTVVGFLAEVSRILAAAGVPVLALSAFSRDHLLIKQDDLARSLLALGQHIPGLC